MTRLIRPIFQVSLGERTFTNQDGVLQSIQVELGEDKRASRCRVTLADPGLVLGSALFDMSFASGGILVESELLRDPQDPSVTQTLVSITGSSTQNTDLSPQERAFLDTLAFAEGTQGIDGYRTMFTGALFEGFERHPDIINTGGGIRSSAAGRYQFLTTTWDSLNLPDFSPQNQDLGAIELIRRRGALEDVNAGRFESAVNKVADEWASMPGSPYGQPTKTMDELREIYLNALERYDSEIAETGRSRSVEDRTKTPVNEKSEKGQELIVAMGFDPENLISYHFIHVGTTLSGLSPDSVVLEGQSIRWLMSRRERQVGYENITLRQLAQQICDRYNITLVMEGDGPLLQYVDQASSDYSLLLRECSRLGFKVSESVDSLTLKPVRPTSAGYQLTRSQLIPGTLQMEDKASVDMPGMRDGSPALGYTPDKAQEPSIHIDRLTGAPIPLHSLDPVGAGGQITAMGMGMDRPVATVAGTGLPQQEVGIVDLQDGSAEGLAIEDEARRVMGYRSRVQLITDTETLQLAPGSMFSLGEDSVPYPLAREWRIHSVRHTWQLRNPLTTALEFYSPQRQKPIQASNPREALSKANPGGHILPIASGRLGDGVGPRSPTRNHMGIDVAAPTGTPIFASADGIVVRSVAADGSGWGDHVVIQHAGDIYSLVGHLSVRDVVAGDTVSQGQKIGGVGSTGRSTGPHLHVEWRKGGAPPGGTVIIPSTLGVTYAQTTGEQRAGFEY